MPKGKRHFSLSEIASKRIKKIVGNFSFGLPPFKHGDLTKLYSENYKVNIPVLVIGSYADLYFPQDSLEKLLTHMLQMERPPLQF